VKILSTKDTPASEWGPSGLVVTAPSYSEGKYCTMYYETNDVEMDLFEEWTKWYDPPLKDTLWNLVKDLSL